MSKVAKRLGRGLSSLVPDLRAVEAGDSSVDEVSRPADNRAFDDSRIPKESEPRSIKVALLDANPFQPRRDFSGAEIESLAASILTSGILQPLVVRPQNDRYQIIAGERRFRAAKLAGLLDVPVIIKDATDQQLIEWALVENIQREDLNPIDRAQGYRQLSDYTGLSPEKVGQLVGEDRSTVTNYLRLLELPQSIQELVRAGALGMGHARCLLGVKDSQEQWSLAESAARNELSVRALEDVVRRKKNAAGQAESNVIAKPNRRSAHVLELQRRFEEALKTKVTIQEAKRKGAGRIVIHYFSLDDFDRVAETLGVELDK